MYWTDVNALIAYGFAGHQFHGEVMAWVREAGFPGLHTCSITELGFVRVLVQAPAYGFTVASARALLMQVLRSERPGWSVVPDTLGIATPPRWVRHPQQLTDGHLQRLAASQGATLATRDCGIQGAYRIL